MELLRNSCQVAQRALLGLHTLTCPRKSLPALCLCVAAQFLTWNFPPRLRPTSAPQKATSPAFPGAVTSPQEVPEPALLPSWHQPALLRYRGKSHHSTQHSPAAKPQHQVQGLALSSINLSCRPGHRLAHFKLCKNGAIHHCVPSWLQSSVEEERQGRSFSPPAKTPGGFFQHH